MHRKIKTLYIIHHSHTDIGYTDLQERVTANQVDYIRTVLKIMRDPKNADFRWNCETLFCVEEFFKSASENEKQEFISLVNQGKIGISANYLNFTDLCDADVYRDRLRRWEKLIPMHTAMAADINGISMGCRDAMIAEGVKFLFINVHCHHGMYPLYQNQNAFFWENAAGKRILVWNGEHYHLGNMLGILHEDINHAAVLNYCGKKFDTSDDPVKAFHQNAENYLSFCEENGYQYDFIIAGASGICSDNAPPKTEILQIIQEHNRRYEDIDIRMVSLQELYAEIEPKLTDAPIYKGDMTDWWANGIGSTPYAVKHFKEGRRKYELCRRLDKNAEKNYPELIRTAQDNLMLYAEHTWGHSSTVTNPFDTMVLNLDMRKNSFASKLHEAAGQILNEISRSKGDIQRYYNLSGKIKAINVTEREAVLPVEFYLENANLQNAEVKDENGKTMTVQISDHPRGKMISFTDRFKPCEEKTYSFRPLPQKTEPFNSRKCYFGAEQIRDIENVYDPVTFHLPYEFENQWFLLRYRSGEGIISFVDKRTGKELSEKGIAPFFTPIYEVTHVKEHPGFACNEETERRIMGRNIRGTHSELYIGKLVDIFTEKRGAVFTELRFRFDLPGTVHADVLIKFYENIPRIDFRIQIGKTISDDIESIFLPMSLDFADSQVYIRKGTEAFRPGIDQLPGSCMEFYASDEGLSYISPIGGAMIAMKDTPLLYMGEMRHHPIRLCDGRPENNERPVYSWIMNNNWETNFKMDLSGFCEFCYSLWLINETEPEKAMDELKDKCFDPYVFVTE